MNKLDEKDMQLLQHLQENCRYSVQQLSKRTGLPPTTVHNRVKRLEHLGVIAGYSAKLDWNKVGKSLVAYVLINVEYVLPTGGKVQQTDVARDVKGLAGVEEVSVLTGGADLLVRVRIKDVAELNEFVVHKLRNIPGVDRTQTMLVLSSF